MKKEKDVGQRFSLFLSLVSWFVASIDIMRCLFRVASSQRSAIRLRQPIESRKSVGRETGVHKKCLTA